jgi:hypothetical protein
MTVINSSTLLVRRISDLQRRRDVLLERQDRLRRTLPEWAFAPLQLAGMSAGYVMSILLANAMLVIADYRLSFAVTAGVAVVGSARRPMTHESFREKLTEEMKEFATGPVDPDLWEWFVRRIYYLRHKDLVGLRRER